MEIFSGVPQGSVIGPLLFVLYINDLLERINNKIKLYAGDTEIMTKITLEDSAYEWTQEWLIKCNISKCMVMHYGANNKNKPLFINGQQLIETKSERDLGVIFSNNLKWKNQIINYVSTVKQMMGMIRKIFALLDPILLRSLYLTFIRCFL